MTLFFFSFTGVVSLFLLTFLQTCCFWILFFPFIFLLNMTPGANTKKNADDITSNDRGEDEGIFCFFSKLDLGAWFYIFRSFFFSFFSFQPVFPPLSEVSTLLCALFSSCLETTVIFNPNDRVDDCKSPGRTCINVSQYEVSNKMQFTRKLFFFFFFGLVTRRESEILKHACMLSFLPSECYFIILYFGALVFLISSVDGETPQ